MEEDENCQTHKDIIGYTFTCMSCRGCGDPFYIDGCRECGYGIWHDRISGGKVGE